MPLTRFALVSFAVLALLARTISAQGPGTIGLAALEAGPTPVGFETILEHDPTRTYRAKRDDEGQLRENTRPMLISVWYPATEAATGSKMRFGDYVELSGQIESFRPLDPEDRERIETSFVTRDGSRDQRLEALWSMETRAVPNAPRRPGRHPLLIYSPGGGGPPHENAVLFEYLASHGYMIAHIPSYAQRTVTKGDVVFDLAGVEVGTRDLEFMYAVLRDHPSVDRTRVGVMGFTWAGSRRGSSPRATTTSMWP